MKLKTTFQKLFSFILKMFAFKKKKNLFELSGDIRKNKHQEYQHLPGV